MNSSRNHFFSGACFALNEDGAVHWSNEIYLIEDCSEFRTGPDQIYNGHCFLLVCTNRGLDDWRKAVGSFPPELCDDPVDVDLDKR